MAVNTICYECNIPCERAGKKLSASTRECNGWRDPKFVGCFALESPEECTKRMKKEQREYERSKPLTTSMYSALKEAGFI